MRFLFYLILFYIIYQVIKYLVKGFLRSKGEQNRVRDVKNNSPSKANYNNAEEVDFTEVKKNKKSGNE